jgi:chitodextrinase
MIIFRKERLETELAGMRDEWRKQMERSLKSVADEAISRITRDSEAMEKEASSRVAKMGEALTEVAVQTENKFNILRDALSDQDERSRQTLRQLEAADLRIQERVNDEAAKLVQASSELDLKLSGLRQYLDEQNDRLQESLRGMQAADERMNGQLSKLDRIVEAAGQNLESRANAVLETTSQEMKRRAEETISAWTEQVRTVGHVTDQEIDRFTDHLKTELSRRLESTNETLKNIETATMAAQESLKSTQENLSKVSEQVLESANGRMHAFVQDLVANAEHQVEESGRAATAKWIAQLEDKATDTTYTAFGSLFKVSEWCEKKAQMRMQAALEKGLNAASDNVREKAENALQEFSTKAEAASGEISKVIEEWRAQIRANAESEGEQLLSRLRTTFTEDAQATLSRASQDLLNQVSSVLETVRAETLERENRMREAVAQLGEQAIQAHEMRLDRISRTSLQETISKFSQESNEVLETMSRSAEERLRSTCNQVFTEAGEALRQRLLELTFLRPAAKAATESS